MTLASTGVNCNHLAYVSTQTPYALLVASVSFVGYIVVGFTEKLGTGIIVVLLLLGIIFAVEKRRLKKHKFDL